MADFWAATWLGEAEKNNEQLRNACVYVCAVVALRLVCLPNLLLSFNYSCSAEHLSLSTSKASITLMAFTPLFLSVVTQLLPSQVIFSFASR